MKKLIFILLLLPIGLMAQSGSLLFASSKTVSKKITLIGIQFSPTVSGKFDFKNYVKSVMTLEQYDNLVKIYKYHLVPNTENEIVQVRVSINGETEEKKYNQDYSFDSFRELIYLSPPAQASITITIVDGTATLADVRDTLCAAWGYTGAANDNTAKLAFLKAYLVNKIVTDYAQQKTVGTANSLQTQVTIN